VKLILLNGPPGSGKSTLARRYAETHPPALALDVDVVRAGNAGQAGLPP
jgi:adenylate kinase family enzyme